MLKNWIIFFPYKQVLQGKLLSQQKPLKESIWFTVIVVLVFVICVMFMSHENKRTIKEHLLKSIEILCVPTFSDDF